jgi:hypothetical protein
MWRNLVALIPLMVSEAKVVAAPFCGTSHNGFKSRQTPLIWKMLLKGGQLVLKTRAG